MKDAENESIMTDDLADAARQQWITPALYLIGFSLSILSSEMSNSNNVVANQGFFENAAIDLTHYVSSLAFASILPLILFVVEKLFSRSKASFRFRLHSLILIAVLIFGLITKAVSIY